MLDTETTEVDRFLVMMIIPFDEKSLLNNENRIVFQIICFFR